MHASFLVSSSWLVARPANAQTSEQQMWTILLHTGEEDTDNDNYHNSLPPSVHVWSDSYQEQQEFETPNQEVWEHASVKKPCRARARLEQDTNATINKKIPHCKDPGNILYQFMPNNVSPEPEDSKGNLFYILYLGLHKKTAKPECEKLVYVTPVIYIYIYIYIAEGNALILHNQCQRV